LITSRGSYGQPVATSSQRLGKCSRRSRSSSRSSRSTSRSSRSPAAVALGLLGRGDGETHAAHAQDLLAAVSVEFENGVPVVHGDDFWAAAYGEAHAAHVQDLLAAVGVEFENGVPVVHGDAE
jgi:hypothetical protein